MELALSRSLQAETRVILVLQISAVALANALEHGRCARTKLLSSAGAWHSLVGTLVLML